MTTTQGANTSTLSSNAAYQPFGPMDSMTYGNGLTRSNTFDQDYRLTGMTVPAVLQRAYSYDNANNITGIANTLDAGRDQVLGYDNLNRLTAANGVYGSFSYSYDANGNRTTKGIDGHPENYTYDTASHHLLETVNGGTRNYSYDANGNTTSNTDRDFVYGENNRLKEAQLNGSPLATYTYNGRGERVLKQGTDTTLYTYDQNGQLIAELDDQGNTLREYIYIDGQPLGYVTNNQVHFVHTDHLGTPQVITDASQQIVWQADYEPFGQTTLTTQTVTYNPRFPGQYFDSETGLHYNYFRDYDPATGRYIQSDPIGVIQKSKLKVIVFISKYPSLGNFLNIDNYLNHLYAYVANNPLVFIDLNGLVRVDVVYAYERRQLGLFGDPSRASDITKVYKVTAEASDNCKALEAINFGRQERFRENGDNAITGFYDFYDLDVSFIPYVNRDPAGCECKLTEFQRELSIDGSEPIIEPLPISN